MALRRWILLIAASMLQPIATFAADTASLDRLVASYPDFLLRHDGSNLFWKDGTSMSISPVKNQDFDSKLRQATIEDQLSLSYHLGPLHHPPADGDDPGRFRNIAFFDKMYGDCFSGGVDNKLANVRWLPKYNKKNLRVTSVNAVSSKLQAVSNELEKLPSQMIRYVIPSSGTFNCRVVKDTGVKSMHAWAAAIDINTKYSDYWLWSKKRKYRNQIPYEIVAIFEKHGFIWGGKWNHYDTMHFEYRPELIRQR